MQKNRERIDRYRGKGTTAKSDAASRPFPKSRRAESSNFRESRESHDFGDSGPLKLEIGAESKIQTPRRSSRELRKRRI